MPQPFVTFTKEEAEAFIAANAAEYADEGYTLSMVFINNPLVQEGPCMVRKEDRNREFCGWLY